MKSFQNETFPMNQTSQRYFYQGYFINVHVNDNDYIISEANFLDIDSLASGAQISVIVSVAIS